MARMVLHFISLFLLLFKSLVYYCSPSKHVIPLNINSFTGELGKDTNHWVGLYISFENDQTVNIDYINPMGTAINTEIRATLTSHLSDKCKIDLSDPLLNQPLLSGR